MDAAGTGAVQARGGIIYNIQALRALAALMVVTVHLSALLRPAGVTFDGNGGVDLFFVISGYLMVLTTRDRAVTPQGFMLNRIARIVPLYWVLTCALFVLTLAAPHLMQSTTADAGQLLKSLLFIPFEKSNGLTQPLLFLGWTLNCEMFFYVLFAAGLAVRNYMLGLALMIGALVAIVVLGQALHPESVILRFFSSTIMLEFAFGMLLALWMPRTPAPASVPVKAAVLGAGIVALILLVVLPGGGAFWQRFLLAGIPAAVVVAAAARLESWNWRLAAPAALLLGDASYSIYLTHPFVTQAGVAVARKLHLEGPAAVGFAGVCMIGACIVGVICYRVLEKPLSSAARRWLVPPAARPVPRAA